MKTSAPRPEAVVAEVAAGQHGVVTRAQLLGRGVTSAQVEHRVATGQLERLHRGVYRTGPVMAPYFREMAAVLACGDAAVLSHWSALRLWRLGPSGGRADPLDVGLPRGFRRRPGLRIHRLHTLEPHDITRIHGIPVTTVARSLFDVAGTSASRDLERALAAGLDRGLVRRAQIRDLVLRHSGAPGTRRLAAAVEADPPLTRSEAEERFLDLVRQARLPEPRANHRIHGVEVDFVWLRERLVVEVDGFVFHSSRAAFEADRRRDGKLADAGHLVLRVTWDQLTKEPIAVVARVARALGRSSAATRLPNANESRPAERRAAAATRSRR